MHRYRIKMCVKLALFLLVASSTASLGQTQGRVVLDRGGATLSALPASKQESALTIEVLGVAASDKELYKIPFRYLDVVDQPFLLDGSDSMADGKFIAGDPGRLSFSIPAPAETDSFLVYNLWKQRYPVLSEEDRLALLAEQTSLSNELPALQTTLAALPESAALAAAVTALREHEDEWTAARQELQRRITRLGGRRAALLEEAALFSGFAVAEAVVAIQGIRAEMARLDVELSDLETEMAQRMAESEAEAERLGGQVAIRTRQRDDTDPAKRLETIRDRLDEIETTLTNESAVSYEVRKLGGLVFGAQRKPIYYRVETGAAASLALTRVGEFPVLYDGDTVVVGVINRVVTEQPSPFLLDLEVEQGAPINTGLVRPTFDTEPARPQSGVDETVFHGVETAYRDDFLPVNRTARANDIFKVSIKAYTRHTESDTTTTTDSVAQVVRVEKSEVVTLIDQDRLPQVRGRYRYNIAFGVLGTALRDNSFVKVKVASNDPDTPEDETRYRIDEVDGGPRVMPVLGLTWYLNAVDIQRPLSFTEAIIPNPTVAFSLSSPADNLFLGLNHEIVRNTQLFYGVHLGEVTDLVNRDDVTEEMNANEPETDQVRKVGFSLGVSFNLDFVTRLFQD